MKFFDDNFWNFGFGTPIDLRFNVGGTKDIMPACWKELKNQDGEVNGYKATCRTVGIAPEDVKVTLGDNGIIVEGKTEYEGAKYDTHYEMPISESIVADIKSIEYKTLNGLTYIYLYIQRPEKKKIDIKKI